MFRGVEAETPPENALGARIAALRAKSGMSMGELAVVVGTPSGRSLVHSWESGRTKPSSKWIVPLAAALGVSVDELLTGEARE